MKKLILIGLLVGFPLVCFAEVIVLKSGQTVEGKIIGKTDKDIKIDLEGVPLTYFFDEIESIDGQSPVAPPHDHAGTSEKAIVQEQTAPSLNNTSTTSEESGPESAGVSDKEWKVWYPEVKDYLNKINQLVVQANHISQKIDSVVKDLMSNRKGINSGNASGKIEAFQRELNQAIGGIDSVLSELYALQPPQELEVYHSYIERFIQYYKSSFISHIELNAEEAQLSRMAAVGALRDSFLELKSEYNKHHAPQGEISRVDNAIMAYDNILAKG